MKTIVKSFVIAYGILTCTASPVFSDEPGPPPPPQEHGTGGNQEPAGAPIDGGLGILLVLGSIYGGKRYLKSLKEKKEDDEKSGKG